MVNRLLLLSVALLFIVPTLGVSTAYAPQEKYIVSINTEAPLETSWFNPVSLGGAGYTYYED